MPFNYKRLVLARQRRGITQTRLAELCNISARNIRRYEAGHASPVQLNLDAIASALDFPSDFFLKDDPIVFQPSGASFRSSSTMTQLQAEAVLASGSIALSLSRFLDVHLALPEPKLPDMHGAEPEQAAKELRSSWGRGNRPIENVIHVLEAHGIRVFSLVEDCLAVDAFCVQQDGQPFVFLNTMKSAEHSRFDAAHELAHLTLHQSTTRKGKAVELEAHRFASAFLMPRDDVLGNVPRTITVQSIVHAKKRWGVSAVALARRLYTLNLLREWEYKQLCIEMSRRGFRTSEPSPMPREQSQLLRKAFSLLKEKQISRHDVAAALGVTAIELEGLIFGLVLNPIKGEGQSTGSARPKLQLLR